MDNYEDKIDNLNGRISKISNQISELQQTQINLMVLKQKIQWDNNKDMLEETIQKIAKVKELLPIAERLEISLTQLALGYCLKNPNVSTIILGASKKEQLKENLGTLSIMDKITDSTIKDINKVLDK